MFAYTLPALAHSSWKVRCIAIACLLGWGTWHAGVDPDWDFTHLGYFLLQCRLAWHEGGLLWLTLFIWRHVTWRSP